MPSPFPGMDPYLEDRSLWRGLHTWLITIAAEMLQPRLVERGYFVTVEGRVWLDDPDRPIYPDVVVWKRSRAPLPTAAAAVGLRADPAIRLRIPRLETRERYLEIRQVGSRKLVTGIEVISPANKRHPKSRALYIRKRKELRAGKVNLVEVDLLRAGKALAALPPTAEPVRKPDQYIVNVIRSGSGYYEYYPRGVRESLPKVGIPLARGEDDVVLDLQAALAHAYEAGAYAIQIDYVQEPRPKLSPANAAWADALLIEKGLRPPKT